MTLLRDVERFLKRWGWKDTRFGTECLNRPSFVMGLRNGIRAKPKTEKIVREFMAAYQPVRPESVGSVVAARVETPSERLASRVEHDVEQLADRLAEVRSAPARRDPVASFLVAVGPETPGEAISLVRERWPSTWARIVLAARERREAPGALMVALIERGLEAEL